MTNTKDFLAGWTGHRNSLLAIIDQLEDKQLSFKPWEKAMTLSELVLHTSGAMVMFSQTVRNGAFTPNEQKTAETVADVKKIVQAETEEAKAIIESLTEEQLNQGIDFFGREMPGAALLELAKDHEVHHKGQLFTYARIAGVETLPGIVS